MLTKANVLLYNNIRFQNFDQRSLIIYSKIIKNKNNIVNIKFFSKRYLRYGWGLAFVVI